ncbi:uncharacterized protein [Miscanthus floridulus]|uniref:uncharacterized protein n=1 Tax=Miscanthus floridulus TaxID=154761 RepID=UPI0034591424
MLRKVHGCPQLHLLQAQDAGPKRGHHLQHFFLEGLECEVESYELASATLASEELAAIGKDIAEGAPDAKRVTRSFGPSENVKEVLVDPDNSANKTVRIGTALFPKLEGVLIDFLHANQDIFA